MDFEERKVLIIIRSRPFGTIINFEGWRAAVGMIGMDHEPTMLFMGDGVYSLLRTMDQTPIQMFKSTYEGFDGRICASKESLEARGISHSDIFDDVEILDERGIGRELTENEVFLTF
ncbi:MAG: DsrE family protein [Candidatus Thorarchaeota archaeon]|nr:MAG: DsrE family protein [Candidatus Thorarchaeota archaeon]